MKTFRTILMALIIALGSSMTLSGCFVDADEEIYDQMERVNNNDSAGKDSNDDQWD